MDARNPLRGADGATLRQLLNGNLADVAPYLSVGTVKCAAVLFLLATGLTVVEKYLASIIVGAAETAAHAAEIGRRLADDEIDIDFSVVFREFEAATLPPMRWFVGRSISKVEKGDFAASGRNFVRCAQVQGLLALIIAVLILWALGLVVCGLGR